MIIAPATDNVLRAGAEVPLTMSETITTNGKTLRVGQRIRLQVASDVRLGTVVVIPAGSPAEGEVTDVRFKGMWGKSGRIEARVLNVRVGDRLIRLSGTFDDKGVTGTAGGGRGRRPGPGRRLLRHRHQRQHPGRLGHQSVPRRGFEGRGSVGRRSSLRIAARVA
ncbi:MAG TPA: hypothetical protein VNH53_08160 [Sphingomicrobium sp.]|nr:hypothetical protein [Sphingomicrobium sp.]